MLETFFTLYKNYEKNIFNPLNNPNYKNIAKYDGTGFDPGYDGLGRNPVNFVIALTF